MDRTEPNYQKKYRQKQSARGLARFEIQIPIDSKAKFDELVEAVAEEYVHPHSKRQRTALARIQVFEEITQNITHEFFELKDKIQALKDEIKALSPNFFKTTTNNIPLPEAINTLPDDPQKLKKFLAKLYHDLQTTKLSATEEKRRAKQFEALYNSVSDYNDQLRTKLNITEDDII